MADKTKRKQLEQLVAELLDPTQFELVLAEFVKAGKDWLLRVYIDHPDGVSIEHTSEVTRLILDALEENDPVDIEYGIEVSSPGVDRPLVKLEDFQRFQDERIYVKLHAPVDGQKVFTGNITALEDEQITLENEADKRTYRFSFSQVAKATLKPILKFS